MQIALLFGGRKGPPHTLSDAGTSRMKWDPMNGTFCSAVSKNALQNDSYCHVLKVYLFEPLALPQRRRERRSQLPLQMLLRYHRYSPELAPIFRHTDASSASCISFPCICQSHGPNWRARGYTYSFAALLTVHPLTFGNSTYLPPISHHS